MLRYDYADSYIFLSTPSFPQKSFSKMKMEESGTSKPKYGNSMITSRLWGPTTTGVPSHLNLPKACAIYSIINWMVAHPNVRGIQIMCILSLPPLLEDEQQRITGQRVGLVEVILCAMLRFPENTSFTLQPSTPLFSWHVLLVDGKECFSIIP